MSSTADLPLSDPAQREELEKNPMALQSVFTAIRSQNTAISNLVTAQSATNATLRSNGTFLWCVLFIAVLAFIQSCVALGIAQKTRPVIEKRHPPNKISRQNSDTNGWENTAANTEMIAANTPPILIRSVDSAKNGHARQSFGSVKRW